MRGGGRAGGVVVQGGGGGAGGGVHRDLGHQGRGLEAELRHGGGHQRGPGPGGRGRGCRLECEAGSGGGGRHRGGVIWGGVIVQQIMGGEQAGAPARGQADGAGVAAVVDVAPAPRLGLRPREDQD